MKQLSKLRPFPWIPLIAGAVGCYLRSRLYSSMDSNGLLPQNHPAGSLSFVLLALTYALCIFLTSRISADTEYARLFPRSRVAAAGSILGGIGIGCSAFSVPDAGRLFLPIVMLGAVSAICLSIAAYFRLREQRPHCLLHCIPVAYLMLRTIAFCRVWGTEPQWQLFFFELLATLFVLIACYYRAELDVQDGNCKKYLFFSQLAVFCCCLCLPGEDFLFHASAMVWLAADYCVLPAAGSKD